jgi:hypothetical protein
MTLPRMKGVPLCLDVNVNVHHSCEQVPQRPERRDHLELAVLAVHGNTATRLHHYPVRTGDEYISNTATLNSLESPVNKLLSLSLSLSLSRTQLS